MCKDYIWGIFSSVVGVALLMQRIGDYCKIKGNPIIFDSIINSNVSFLSSVSFDAFSQST